MGKSSVDRRDFLKSAAVGAAALAANRGIADAQQSTPPPAPKNALRSVTLEEHFSTPEALDAVTSAWPGDPVVALLREKQTQLTDLGHGRLSEMDAARIDVQVLSLQGIGMERLAPAAATALARETNDRLSAAVKANPGRLAGFAAVALQEPEKAALELDRCIRQLGFKGVMVNGTLNGRFLDHSSFTPLLEAAQSLDVPLYLHPGLPPATVRETYYRDLPTEAGFYLSIAGWGWHVDTGMHCLRLILSGVFDRYPKLNVILGHLGEGIPFFLARSDNVLTPRTKGLKRRISEYFRENVFLTTSGFFSVPPFLCALEVVGADRIMFSVDHPFSPMPVGRAFLDGLPISPYDLAKIAHGNAERVLKLPS